ncbi:uncharacterized protein LOC127750251 [Frankliniella occidentalis]|uniref:Uncharacterized protein LOC127750251 n=1 Tax=Frankliniella occidentalis TaxID=133901 RepID=A0A9C6XQA7_FRAOC|nr:uncharacterized protein LOC127750251 [Frankliniella occidentalis]
MPVSAALEDLLQTQVGGPAWVRALARVGLLFNAVCQLGLLVAFGVNLDRGSMDRAAVALFFFLGFFCIMYGLWTRGVCDEAMRRSLVPLLEVARTIETDALAPGGLGALYESAGLRRMRRLDSVMPHLVRMVWWQAPTVAFLLTTLFVVTGRYPVPHWPEGSHGRDLVEHGTVALHFVLIVFGGRIFLVVCGLHWMSSLCMDCCLHLLADRAARAASWTELVVVVRLHQRLQAGFVSVQGFFAEDLSVMARLILFFGLIGALRIAFGVKDINNIVILTIVYSYIVIVCIAGEMQESAGDEFHHVICGCPWESWRAADQGKFHLLLGRTVKPAQVRFRYFGAMKLDTLSTIFNNMFKYTQVLSASLGGKKWTTE